MSEDVNQIIAAHKQQLNLLQAKSFNKGHSLRPSQDVPKNPQLQQQVMRLQQIESMKQQQHSKQGLDRQDSLTKQDQQLSASGGTNSSSMISTPPTAAPYWHIEGPQGKPQKRSSLPLPPQHNQPPLQHRASLPIQRPRMSKDMGGYGSSASSGVQPHPLSVSQGINSSSGASNVKLSKQHGAHKTSK